MLGRGEPFPLTRKGSYSSSRQGREDRHNPKVIIKFKLQLNTSSLIGYRCNKRVSLFIIQKKLRKSVYSAFSNNTEKKKNLCVAVWLFGCYLSQLAAPTLSFFSTRITYSSLSVAMASSTNDCPEPPDSLRPHTATGLGTGSYTPGVSGVFRVTSVTGALDER